MGLARFVLASTTTERFVAQEMLKPNPLARIPKCFDFRMPAIPHDPGSGSLTKTANVLRNDRVRNAVQCSRENNASIREIPNQIKKKMGRFCFPCFPSFAPGTVPNNFSIFEMPHGGTGEVL
jgi:hypothetical protein